MVVSRSERKLQAQQKTGTENVADLVLDLRKLEDTGIFTNIVASGFSVLTTRLGFEILGVTGVPKNLAMRVGSPSVGLLPDSHRKALSAPVAEAYGLLRKYGIQMLVAERFFGSNMHRWIPWSAWDRFQSQFDAELARLDEAKADVLANYEEVVEQMVGSLAVLAKDARHKLTRQGVKVPSDFEQTVTAELVEKIPKREHIADGMWIHREVGVLTLTSEIIRERADAETLKARELEAREEVLAHEAVIHARAASVEAEERLRRKYIEDELRREKETKEALRQLKIQQTEAALAQTVNPLKEAAEQLAATLHAAAQQMAESIAKNGYVHPSTAAKAREMAEWFRAMNYQNDAEMEALVTRLSTMVAKEPAKRDMVQFSDTISQIIEATKAEAERLSATSRYAALEL